MPQLIVYSVHLENNCGISGRWEQFQEIVQDSMFRSSSSSRSSRSEDGGEEGSRKVPIIIGGDLNTLCSGVAKLLPRFADMFLWQLSPFLHEAAFWQKTLLHSLKGVCGLSLWDPFHKTGRYGATSTHAYGLFNAKLDWLLVEMDFPGTAGTAAGTGPAASAPMGTDAGTGLRITSHEMGSDYISDHKWLRCDVSMWKNSSF